MQRIGEPVVRSARNAPRLGRVNGPVHCASEWVGEGCIGRIRIARHEAIVRVIGDPVPWKYHGAAIKRIQPGADLGHDRGSGRLVVLVRVVSRKIHFELVGRQKPERHSRSVSVLTAQRA